MPSSLAVLSRDWSYPVAPCNGVIERRSSLENPQTPLSFPAEWLLDIFNGGRNIGSTESRTWAKKVRLPTERSGTVLVFKAFDRVSYGLIIGATDIIQIGDLVRTP